MKEYTIGILYIATGRYTVFWEEFFKTCEKNFIPNIKKTYYVFTDNNDIKKKENVRIIKVKPSSWPYATMDRFYYFVKSQKEITNTYIYFFNGNTTFRQKIGTEILPKNNELVTFRHTVYYYSNPRNFPYDRNKKSQAYIQKGEGTYYYQGSFFGGRKKTVIDMSNDIIKMMVKDKQSNTIPVWHDESYLNKYLISKETKQLPFEYAATDEFAKYLNVKIAFRDKRKVASLAYLRGKNDTKKRTIDSIMMFGENILKIIIIPILGIKKYLLLREKISRLNNWIHK